VQEAAHRPKSVMNSFLYSESEDEKIALKAFCEQWLKETFWPFKEFELSLKIPGTFLIYAKTLSGLDEGYTGLALGRAGGDGAELFFIFMRPDLRGRGQAQRLLTDFEAHARFTMKARSVMLEVRPSNDAAVRLYEKVGYQRAGRRKRYYRDGEDALIFEKVFES
jgi:ribosomal protein S18 acetylase RimI-like enzyme